MEGPAQAYQSFKADWKAGDFLGGSLSDRVHCCRECIKIHKES